ncbi:MAG: regulatory iron-sulfur-containing complex subunit RicT [Trueperaceae bacterium]|nr:regulatory iron-sulfur-containing complex subunit RicT [Trueperaceae bacterium]
MQSCIGVRFDNGPKIHWMDASGVADAAPPVGTRCIVRSRRGVEVGTVRTEPRPRERSAGEVLRAAHDEDLARAQRLAQKAEDLTWLLRARARQEGVRLKIVSLEFTLDEAALAVQYTAENHPSLRGLTQELARHTGARVEFVNVGPRDESRILGTLGACGTGSCSSTWMQSFNSVSIRMARDQQLPLNPEKISGPCGRLMCCLQFEHPTYKELLGRLPKRGGKACHTDTGACGKVVKLDPLRGTADLKTDDGYLEGVPADKLERPHKR